MVSKDRHNERDLTEELSAFLDGELSQAESEKLRREVEQNPQARRELEDLRKVSQSLGQLPRVAAPNDLAEGVMHQIERDILLDRTEKPTNAAGHNHLLIRRFLAAAAVLVLTGAIGTIIYNVLSKPQNTRPEDYQQNVTAKAPKKTVRAEESGYAMKSEKGAEALDYIASAKTEINVPEIKYSKLHLRVVSPDVSARTNRLEQILIEQKVENVVRTYSPRQDRQYAFLCSIEQFQSIFNTIRQDVNQLDIIVPDGEGPDGIVIAEASERQAMKLAGESNSTVQLTHAVRFAMARTSPSVETQTDISSDLFGLIARNEPDIPGLQTLAPRIDETAPDDEKVSSQRNGDIVGVIHDDTEKTTPSLAANEPAVSSFSVSSPRRGRTVMSEPAQMVALVVIMQQEEKVYIEETENDLLITPPLQIDSPETLENVPQSDPIATDEDESTPTDISESQDPND